VTRSATIGGVTALPKREQECVTPCAKPRRLLGVQLVSARPAAGSVAPSPMPSKKRTHSSAVRLPIRPVQIVVATQTMPQTSSVRREPRRSLTQPPITWNSA